jgi:hypothetical protein
MSVLGQSIPITGPTDAADRRRRIVAIVGASSGNLVDVTQLILLPIVA